jgi:neurofibromin 1
MLFGTGSSDIRAAVHGLVINIAHSLYNIRTDDKLQGLRFHLSELNQPQFKLHFGIGGQEVSPFSKPDPSEKKLDKVSLTQLRITKPSKLVITAVEPVANALFSIIAALSPNNDAVNTTWHARWRGLLTQAAFTPNIALQPRACIALGVICKSRALVSNDLLELVLESLREAIRKSMNDNDHDLSVSLIICLSHLYEYLPASSPYFKTIFWVAMAIVQISDEKLFQAALPLLQVILKIQVGEGFEKGVEETYMAVRDGPVDQILSKLEQITGMSFKTSFSFGVAGNLLKVQWQCCK